MIFNEIDKETLKELRGKLYEKKKAQERIQREYQRIKDSEKYRLLQGNQKRTPDPKGKER